MDGVNSLGAKVLLAEDNEVNQKIACKILAKIGCTVVCAENGEVALSLWGSQPFDLILMDMQMPVLDGLDATRRLRQLEASTGQRIPIIALTANVMNEDIARCREAGMDAHLPKPFLVEDVIAMVQQWTAKLAA